MDRVKQVLSYLAPKQKKRQPPKWHELSPAWQAGIIFVFFGPCAVYFSAVLLSVYPIPVLSQYLPWLSLMTIMDVCETAGVLSIVALGRAFRLLVGKPSIQESFRGLTFFKLMLGWIYPFAIFVTAHMNGSKLSMNFHVLHDDSTLWALDFLPELRATLDGSVFLQGRLIYAQLSVVYLFCLPLALTIHVGHRIWRHWKVTRAQGGIVLSGEDGLAIGQVKDEKALMGASEPAGTVQMV